MNKHKKVMNHLLLFSVFLTSVVTSTAQVFGAELEPTPAAPWHEHKPFPPQNISKLTQAEVSRNAKDYNAIILGDHIVSKADIEGATVVQGNVILKSDVAGVQPHFDYGASGSNNPNLIGDKGLQPNVPSLMMGGSATGPFGKIKVLGNNVGVRKSVADISTFDADAKRVNFTDNEMDDFMAKMKSQVVNRHNSFVAIANTVKPTGQNFTVQPSANNPRIGVVSLGADDIKINGVYLPDLTKYDRVIIKIKANNVVFSNGAMIKPNGTPLDVNAPVGSPENNLMRQYAAKLTWIMDDATNNVAINGFGLVGDFYALNSYLDGNGGNINGRLFVNTLKQDGGFEVHNLPEGAKNNAEGIPPLNSTPEIKPNIPTENELGPDESETVEEIDPVIPGEEKATETETPKLEESVKPTEKPKVEVESNQPTESEVEETESVDDLETVPPFTPDNGKAIETETPKLEESAKPTEKPKVEVESNQPTESEVEETESVDELETLPPFMPNLDKGTEVGVPGLENTSQTTDKPKIEVEPKELEVEKTVTPKAISPVEVPRAIDAAIRATTTPVKHQADVKHDVIKVAKNQETMLPNTGERSMNWPTVLGLSILSIVVALGMRKARKRTM